MTDETVFDEVELDPLDEVPEIEAVAEGEAESKPVEESSPSVEANQDTAQDAIQKRINKITADKYAEKQRADELAKRLAELEGAKAALPSEAPKLEDFDYDDAAHTAAVVQYQVKKELEAQANQQRQQVQQQSQREKAQEFAGKESAYLAKAPDYAEAVANLPQFPPDTLDAIYSLDNSPETAHYLGKHLDVAYEIANAPPHIAAVKLGQIAAGLASATATKVKPSSAPEPINTITGAGGVSKNLDDMSMDEIMAL